MNKFLSSKSKVIQKIWRERYSNKKEPSLLDITVFFQQLATLILADIPMLQSFELLQAIQNNTRFKESLKAIKNAIETGKSFIESLAIYPHYFDNFTRELLHVGLQSGTFALMLQKIAHHHGKMLTLRKQIKQALFYPLIVAGSAIIVSFIMLTFVIPRFAELFQSMHTPLPDFTRWVIGLSFSLQAAMKFLPLPFFVFFLFKQEIKLAPGLKLHAEILLLSLPFFGSFIQKIKLSHFLQHLNITLKAGMPLTDALKAIAFTLKSQVYAQIIVQLHDDIAAGHELHYALTKSGKFPLLVTQMVKIGEESGKLETILEKTLSLYEAEIAHFIANLSRLTEPLIMIVLGVLIGGLVIAMYLPIFRLGAQL